MHLRYASQMRQILALLITLDLAKLKIALCF
jgi:hypothetical protein